MWFFFQCSIMSRFADRALAAAVDRITCSHPPSSAEVSGTGDRIGTAGVHLSSAVRPAAAHLASSVCFLSLAASNDLIALLTYWLAVTTHTKTSSFSTHEKEACPCAE